MVARRRQPTAMDVAEPRKCLTIILTHPLLRKSLALDWLSANVEFTYTYSYLGCGTMRRYGLGDFQPSGYFCFASSSETEGRIITSPPSFQLAGVATLCLVVSWMESSTRNTSSKLRPVLIG